MRVWLLSSDFRSSVGSWLFTALVNCTLLAVPLAAGFSAAAGAAAAGAAAGAAAAGAAAALPAAGASAAKAEPQQSRPAARSVRRVLLIFCMRISLDTDGLEAVWRRAGSPRPRRGLYL